MENQSIEEVREEESRTYYKQERVDYARSYYQRNKERLRQYSRDYNAARRKERQFPTIATLAKEASIDVDKINFRSLKWTEEQYDDATSRTQARNKANGLIRNYRHKLKQSNLYQEEYLSRIETLEAFLRNTQSHGAVLCEKGIKLIVKRQTSRRVKAQKLAAELGITVGEAIKQMMREYGRQYYRDKKPPKRRKRTNSVEPQWKGITTVVEIPSRTTSREKAYENAREKYQANLAEQMESYRQRGVTLAQSLVNGRKYRKLSFQYALHNVKPGFNESILDTMSDNDF